MSDYYEPDDEMDAAADRIARIRGGGSAGPPPAGRGEFEEVDSDALSRARSRARTARQVLGEEELEPRGRAGRAPAGGGTRSRQAIIIIGGVVGLGVILVVVIFLVSRLGGGGGGFNLFATDTPTPTFTPTPTETPLPTETPTPTKVAPALNLPPLTCIFQSGAGCFDYCNDPANANECQGARDFVQAQSADPDVFFQCLGTQSGPNSGEAQECLKEAWRAANP
jgi:hypothetical protein